MKVDIAKLDEKIRKLQHLRELAADPELASLLADFVTPNGNGVPKNGHSTRTDETGLTESAIRACKTFAGSFTATGLTHKMEEMGYTFTAKDKGVATYGVMNRLKDKGVLVVVEQGGPGKPAQWRCA
jgi:hypothetical protein